MNYFIKKNKKKKEKIRKNNYKDLEKNVLLRNNNIKIPKCNKKLIKTNIKDKYRYG